jgi:hypothetical protein
MAPGDHVLHASYGPCVVLGVQADALAGDVLTIAPMRHVAAVVRIPVARVQPTKLRPLTAAQAEEMAAAPMDHRAHCWKARKRWL